MLGLTPIFVEMPAGLEELVPEYLGCQKARANRLEQLLAVSDWESIRTIAHDLKGTGTSYGFPLLTEFGAAMERSVKEGDLLSVREQTKHLVDYLGRVQLVQAEGLLDIGEPV